MKQKIGQLLVLIGLFSSLSSCMAAESPSIDSEGICSSVNLTKESEFYDRYFHETFSIDKQKVFSVIKQKLMKLDKQLNENYKKLLKEHASYDDQWVMQNVASSPAQAFHHLSEGDLIGFSGCKPHACNNNKMYLLFSPATKKITITIEYSEGSKSFGQLPTTLKSECFKEEK